MKKNNKKKLSLNPQTKTQEKKNRKYMCAEARQTMSRKEYKEFISAGRNTMGLGLHGDVFKNTKNDKKGRRKEGKRICRDAQCSIPYSMQKIYPYFYSFNRKCVLY